MVYDKIEVGKQGAHYWLSPKGNRIYKARLRVVEKKNNPNPQSKLFITHKKYTISFD
tara:strand:+ start:110 stop:280 length:171 start_codon:yes stop_codon:yes gene_type:complete